MTSVKALFLQFRRVFSIGSQLVMVVAANAGAFLLRFDANPPEAAIGSFLQTLPWLVAVRGLTFLQFRLYEGLWRYTSVYDLSLIVRAVAASSVIFFVLIKSPLGPPFYPRSVFLIDALLLLLMLGGVRMSRRIYAEMSRGGSGKRILVYGAGNAGELIVRDMHVNQDYGYKPIGFVDDDRLKVGRRIHGIPVLGTRSELDAILKKHKPDEILIAMTNSDASSIRGIVRALQPYKVPIKTLPKLTDIIGGKLQVKEIRSLALEDLLARPPVGLDPTPVRQLIRGRRVMVTGAGGSIGSELCRQIVELRPASLIMFERYENSLHAIRLELADKHPSCALHAVIGDVADTTCVSATMERHTPDIVFHAAAHKHVPLMEENPCEAIKNNVRGTRLLAQAAEFCGVDRFIFISTDKAVNPTSVMGASKRLAELAVQMQALGSGTSFATVRFGNVLGSNGSVVPRFLEQIKRGGPVTVTHPDMRRFFMLIPEAVQLVMHAASQADSGGTYVLEMGEQVKLVDMARDMIRLSGFVPDEDIKIEFTGLRPGEKLYEELVGIQEAVGTSTTEKIHRVSSRRKLDPSFYSEFEAIETLAARGDVNGVLASLNRLIPEYRTPREEDTILAEAACFDEAAMVEAEEEEIARVEGDSLYQYCPSCISARVHRSRSRSLIERVRRTLTAERLFRCDACGWRGWLMPIVYSEAEPVEQIAIPDLTTLDRVVETTGAGHRSSFAPRDLH